MHARLGEAADAHRAGLDKAVAALDARQAYLDGELCGVGPDGVPSFNIVQLASGSGTISPGVA
jgi:hypothetical protein